MPFIARSIAITTVAVVTTLAHPVTYAQTPSTGSGQTFPARPIRFLVPVPAGSTTDIVTRIVAQKKNGRRLRPASRRR